MIMVTIETILSLTSMVKNRQIGYICSHVNLKILFADFLTIMPSIKPGREIEIPDGHKICGIALEMDSKGFVTWADFKTWKPQKND